MPRSSAEPRPVVLGRYRYSRWRWRALVGVVDAVGSVLARAWRAVRPRPFVPAPRRILLVQLDHLGDAVLSSPLIPRLRAAYPGAKIHVLASASNREVFAADPRVDRVHLATRNWFARRPGSRALGSAVWIWGRALRAERYDLGIDVRGDILTVLVLALAGIPRRVGWAMGGGGFLLTDVAEWVPGRHEVESRLALLDRLGIAGEAPARVEVAIDDRDRAEVARKLREAWPARSARPAAVPVAARAGAGLGPGSGRAHAGRPPGQARPHVRPRAHASEADWLHAGRFGAEAPILAVHLGAGTEAKRWPTRHWRELLGRFLTDGWRVVIVGGADDAPAAGTLEDHPALSDWSGRLALTETAALLERADLFIGADSGPAHLAACAGTPSVILFSGTNRPAQWRPWSRRALVLRRKVACSPCHQKACPLAGHPCMAGLGPDRVYRAARRWWARLHRAESPHAPI